MREKTDILIVEDDIDLSDLIADYLISSDYTVDILHDPLKVLMRLEDKSYKLILLDLSLPKMDGLILCERIRKKYSIPIIIMSARDNVSDKVLGLEKGADDYLPKPFDTRELIARIQVQLRRVENTLHTDDIFEDKEFKCDKQTMKIYFKGDALDLTVAEFGVLKLFLQKRGIVFSREDILDYVDGMNWSSGDRSIDVIISRLRAKLNDDPRKPKYFESVRGIGYRMILR
ncbi:response regulator transcription factor [Sulfurovum sp. XGS-02]|uniref:response regulator transcription factor n=1 Tax=Sulfurovum sp. XGS-02 TaxID=2925411 RepID=UPI0020702515|nr:response regulator transcription factor [Sulfurovum sp. XGS-02]UPT76940.1 response regulator transcription factor [Sulfurovum sp. XGS-02]